LLGLHTSALRRQPDTVQPATPDQLFDGEERSIDERKPGISAARRFVPRLAIGLCLAVAVARFFSVDIAGIVTNDSLGYLQRSQDPFAAGFVTQGYRQAAYPLVLAISTWVGDVVGWDAIFGMALLQRALLAAGIVLTIWAMRWWSVPLVALFTSAPYILHADYLLPEGLLIPLCVLCGGLLAAVVMNRIQTMVAARLALVAIVATAVVSASIKLQYTALVFVCAAAAWLLRRDDLVTRRLLVTCFATAGAVVGLLALFQSIENRHERGVFEPVSERSFAEWYGAWIAVFEVHPDRATDPALAEWYDGGNLYTYLEFAMEDYPDYPERSEVLRDRIDEMFEAAGTSALGEHLAAFVGALSGGRTDDLETKSDVMLGASPGDPWIRLSQNRLAWTDRIDELITELNDGLPPGFISFGPVFDASQDVAGDYRWAKDLIAWSSIIVMLLALAMPGRHRPAALGILLMAVAISTALASGYIDNARYLLGPLSLIAFGGVMAVRALAHTAVKYLGHTRGDLRVDDESEESQRTVLSPSRP
jgi:hypothetical protein